jgi:dTDP-4-dehydrorhamnose reductase
MAGPSWALRPSVRVLVTGAGGRLGGRVATLLHQRRFDVVAAHRRSLPPSGLAGPALDLVAPGAVGALLEETRPDAVVHAAVLGRADRCEEAPEDAEILNARLPGLVARACRARGIRLIALSTDLVLDGGRPFSAETATPHPLSVYGRTKLRGEDAVLEAFPAAAVLRVALVVGRGHGSAPTASEAVAWALSSGDSPRLFADEFRTPIDPESVTAAVSRLLALEGAGRYHLGGPERLSRLDLGRRVARVLGLPETGIVAARQADHVGPEARPPDTSLDSSRARTELGWTPRPLDEALAASRRAPE